MAEKDKRRHGELVAVVDLGSTAVRFLLARVVRGSSYRVLAEHRVATRLGGGANDWLSRASIDDTLLAVRKFFVQYSAESRGPRVIAVATSAVRDARNREQLLGPLRYDEGIDVEVLSARDEARLGVYAALDGLDFDSGVVADLGGASLQLSRVRNRRMVATASLPLGAVRTTRQLLRHDPPSPRELQGLGRRVCAQLVGALSRARRGEMMGVLGGSVRTLGSIYLKAHRGERKHRHGLQLYQSDVTAIRERLESVSARRRRKIRGLKKERAD